MVLTMTQGKNSEPDLHYILRVLVHSPALEVDWYGVAGVTKGPDQDRGPANRRLVSAHFSCPNCYMPHYTYGPA